MGIIRPAIISCIKKGYCVFLYDFKFDDLTKIAYNTLLKYQGNFAIPPKFYVINFDDLSITNRCNPLEPQTMYDITDASEAARTILLGLNREWIKKTGDFWVESSINFMTAIIWFLRKYKNGKYCTLPHVIELMQVDYDDLWPVLGTETEIEVLINPFLSAYLNQAREQLEGQIGSAKISIARLSSPSLYYVLSGDEFSLDINNPKEPKLVAVGNNPGKVQIYGAVLSLYISRVGRLVARKGMHKCAIIADEFSSIFWNGIESLIAIARGYRVAIILAIQDYAQLKKDYSREQAEVIMNICSNLICGQAVGDTAKLVSDRIGKIVQQRESVSINRTDTSISRNTQLDLAVPPSRISNLSSGEIVGVVADNPDMPIKHKAFHTKLKIDFDAINAEEKEYKPLKKVRNITPIEVQNVYITIKNDIFDLIESELKRIKSDPNLSHLIIKNPAKEPKEQKPQDGHD
ncbi:type IV secretory system conjugative DNA transfer family protein [Chitinophaga sp. CC14]|uniref:type IV secretory system conjugative DNA transfer family protein n=1 Tax=Chitinophaga sp. CC14 TaxID=3029199 RepID=UPI003B801A5B